jgi:hypothetical protein
MLTSLPLLSILILGPLPIETWAVRSPIADIQPATRRQTKQDEEFKAINTLYKRAYSLFGQDEAQSRRLLRDAASRLKAWINKYEKDPSKLSFLLQQARLGLYMEAAGKEKEAARAYKSCLSHRLLDSSDAVLKLCENGEQSVRCPTQRSVREVVTQRLGRLMEKGESPNESQPSQPKIISKSGRSKGTKKLPPRLWEVDEDVP